MIIDQLNATVTDNLTDELPVEQGTLTYKTTWSKILALFKSNTTASDITSTDGNVQTDLNGKQATLVSGTNIKTINGNSLLGSGDLTIAAGGVQFNKTLSSASWTTYGDDIVQVVSDAKFLASDYAYIVTPRSDDLVKYANCGVRAASVAVDGQMTFYCNYAPSEDLTVQFLRLGI